MSSNRAKQYHSITIGDKNTWDDWHLVPTSRPLVNPPSIKTRYVTIPGKNGALDLTNVLTGRSVFQNRTGSWEFFVLNINQIGIQYSRKYKYSVGDYCVLNGRLFKCNTAIPNGEVWNNQHWTQIYNETSGLWESRYASILSYLHGKEFQIILDDDDAYYYTGRFSVNQWKSSAGNSTITIDYNVGPYKKERYGLNDRWLWDPFNFETGVIAAYKNLVINGTLDVTLYVTTTITALTITCTQPNVVMSWQEMVNDNPVTRTISLSKGDNNLDTLYFESGPHVLTFTGSGRISIDSIGGLL